jgi:hypothetical protein
MRKMVYSQQERVFILERYFSSKSFVAVREAFHRVYPDKDIPNKATVNSLVKKFRECLRQETCSAADGFDK